MNLPENDNEPQTNREKPGFAAQAAKASWMTFIILFVLLALGRQAIGVVVTEIISLGLILLGLGLAIFALASIPRCGRQGILAPALAGLFINGMLLFIFFTNFCAARAKARVAGRASDSQQTATADARVVEFHRGPLAFNYDARYEVRPYGNQGQIVLTHADSQVLLVQYPEAAEVNESLQNVAVKTKAAFEQKHYSDILLGEIEPLRSVSRSAGKVTLKYTAPGRGRIVEDIYFISSQTNAIALTHFYAEDRTTAASPLFQPVLNSFLK